MLKKLLQLIVVMLITASGVMAQTVQVATVTESPGDIQVPVDMLGFTGANGSVAAMTLTIEFNSDLMDFNGLDSTQLVGQWLSNANGNTLTVTYTAANGAGYDINGKAFNIIFHYKGGFSSDLTFDEANCEVANSSLGTITSSYINGSVSQSTAVGTISMTNLVDTVGNTVDMPVTMVGAGFDSITSMTFMVTYDEFQLTFSGIAEDAITGVTANANNGILEIEWAGNGTIMDFSSLTHLFDIQFVYNGGNADVAFSAGCEIIDGVSQPIATDFVDGTVTAVAGSRSLTISNVAGHVDDTTSLPVNVPVMAANFTGDNVGAITMHFSYDATMLTYSGYTAQQLSGWTVNSSTSGEVTFEWSSTSGATVIDGALITLNFVYDTLGGVAAIEFEPGTIIKDVYSTTIPTNYLNGTVSNFSVGGQLTYNGDASRPIGTSGSSATTVYLKNVADSTIAYTTTTDASGNYAFATVAVGNYFLDATTTIDATYSYDINDALETYDHVVGTITLTGLEFKAADVIVTDDVDINDAFTIYDAIVAGNNKTVTGWDAPDWIFENPTVVVTTISIIENFMGIASGDATGDFTPVP